MSLRTAALLALATSFACHSSSTAPAPAGSLPSAPASTAEVDALWKLAPDGATLGFVASPRALQMTEHAVAEVEAFVDATPAFASATAELRAALAKHQVPSPTLAALGATSDRGAALFIVGDHAIVILPIGDRDKFLGVVHGTKGASTDQLADGGTCMTTHGVYACTDDPKLYDALGKGTLTAAAAGARGDLEAAGKDLSTGTGPVAFAIVGQLARGAITVRGTVDGIPATGAALYGKPSSPRTEGDKTTGFAMFNAKGQLANLPLLPALELAPGVDLGALMKTFDDPITATSQSTTIDLYIPLTDATLAHALVDHCGEGPVMAAVQAKKVDGACQLALPYAAGTVIRVAVDGNVLHIGQAGASAGASVEQTALGKEIADGSWQGAVYGRGSLLAISATTAQQIQQAPMPPLATAMLSSVARVMMMLNEVGAGVRLDGTTLHFELALRTAWSNPDAVVSQLLQIQGSDVLAGHVADRVAPIVAANPGAPLAGDVHAGFTAMMAPTTVVGALAAVATPAFLDYLKKSKKPEAELQLGKLGKNLKVYYVTNATFPVGDAALLPAAPCCQGPGGKCPASTQAFEADTMWNALGFELDEPSLFQYRYHSDGKTALVEAIGDLDCDGTAITYRLHADAPDGNPHVVLEQPPPNSD